MCAAYKIILESNVLFLRYPELLEGGNLLVIPTQHEPGGRGGGGNYNVWKKINPKGDLSGRGLGSI